MSEDGLRLARLYYQAWNTRDLSIPGRIFAPDFSIHDPGSPVPVHQGPEGVSGRIALYCTAFPDLHIEVEEMLDCGDTVVTTWVLTGTHEGPFQGVEATGRRVSVAGTTLHRIADGRIVEARVNWDTLSLMEQIGAVEVVRDGQP